MKCILVLLTRRDSGELCCPATALIYIPPTVMSVMPTSLPKGRGDIVFWCGSCWLWHSLLSALCLVNLWVDSDQTYVDTSLGWGKQVIRFW